MILFERTSIALDRYFRAVALKQSNPEASFSDHDIESLRLRAKAWLEANGARKVKVSPEGATYETPRNKKPETRKNDHLTCG